MQYYTIHALLLGHLVGVLSGGTPFGLRARRSSCMIPQETEDLEAKESRLLLAFPYLLGRKWHLQCLLLLGEIVVCCSVIEDRESLAALPQL